MNENVVTLEMLEKADACWEQREAFAARFGTSVVVTREQALEHAEVFDWHFAANEFLTDVARGAFYKAETIASREYNTAIEPFVQVYEKARDAAWAVFDKTEGDSNTRHQARVATVTAAAAEFEKAIASHTTTYKRATAAAFADAFLSPENQAVNACEHATAE